MADGGDARRKRASREEQRRRWMEDRQNTITQNNAYHQTKNEMNHNNASPRDMRYSSDCNGNSAGRLCDSRELCDESALFNRLTERITQQIRRDVKEEITNNINSNDVRYAMVEKMDKYLEAELHTHVCKICFELMTSPNHTPMLLFPCGHTFCKTCIDRHSSNSKKKSTCPYCRHAVESIAINHSLKDLIDKFAAQREKVKSGKSNLKDIFDAGGRESSLASSQGVSPSDESSYKMRIQANDMRRVILENQLEEDVATLEKVQKRKKNITAATKHLQKERHAAEEKLQLLQDEIALIDKHLAEQNDKLQEATASESSIRESMSLVEMSITGIKAEIDKLQLIANST